MSPRKEIASAAAEIDANTEPRYFSAQVSQARRFFLDLNPEADDSLTVVSGGCENCRADYVIERPGFEFPAIELVARGRGRLWLEGREAELTPGVVYAYGPGLSHRMESDARNPLVKYFCIFAGKSASALLEECQLSPGKLARVSHPDQIQQVFEDLILHGRGDHPNRARVCTVALQYLLMKINDMMMPFGETGGGAFATYLQCRRYIEEHYLEVRTLSEVARACHLDLSYLCRLFQRFGRERPNRYLQHLRLSRAAELLQNSGRPVKDVADELGFSDPFNFSRAFQRAFGMPPGRVRRRAWKSGPGPDDSNS
jgi:AraC-like DNA-binding protein